MDVKDGLIEMLEKKIAQIKEPRGERRLVGFMVAFTYDDGCSASQFINVTDQLVMTVESQLEGAKEWLADKANEKPLPSLEG